MYNDVTCHDGTFIHILPPSRTQMRLRNSSPTKPLKVCFLWSWFALSQLLPIAARAYRQALATLSTLTALPPSQTFNPPIASSGFSVRSFFGAFFPNIHGQGPIGSTARIVIKTYNLILRYLSGGPVKEGLGKKREEELRGKAIKVIDLLQHSAELGNMDALYTLSQVSLVSYFFEEIYLITINCV